MTDETKLTPMQKVDELIERGKSKGGLTYKEVIDTLGNDALAAQSLSPRPDNVMTTISSLPICGTIFFAYATA